MEELDISFNKYKTHVYISGDLNNDKIIVLLHGGPGHDSLYLKPFFDLNKHGYTVITYDQLGGGKSSSIIGHSELYTIDIYVKELANLIQKLKIKNYDLLGHSWGGMLAQEYVLRMKPKNLNKLILFSSLSSSKIWSESNYKLAMSILKKEKDKKILEEAYKSNNFFDKKINKLCMNKIWKKFYRIKDNTSPYKKDKHKKKKGEIEIYEYMWGKNDLFSEGTLKDWDITSKIKNIKVPTLIIHGKYDQSTIEVNKAMLANIPNSKEVFLSNSGHGGYYNEYNKMLSAIASFLK